MDTRIATTSIVPRYPDLAFPVLKVVRQRGGSATIEEIEEDVATLIGLSEDALSVPHKGSRRTEFQYRLAWVRTYLKKASALQNSERGVWSLTEIGEQMSEAEARGVFGRVRTELQRQKSRTVAEIGDLDVDDQEEGWIERLLSFIGEMSPAAFERLAQRLLRESGFIKVEVTGRPSDGGIDGLGVLRMNLVSFHVLFQCKRWRGSVGTSVVRDFRGAMVGRADKGLIVTTGTFTADARREATRDGAPAIDLIDGDNLCHLLKDRRLGVAVKMVEQIELDRAFFTTI